MLRSFSAYARFFVFFSKKNLEAIGHYSVKKMVAVLTNKRCDK